MYDQMYTIVIISEKWTVYSGNWLIIQKETLSNVAELTSCREKYTVSVTKYKYFMWKMVKTSGNIILHLELHNDFKNII